MRIVIAGCGYVGVALGVELAEDGHEVWGLRRNVDALPDAIRPLRADLGDAESLAGVPDADAVVYMASPSGDRSDAGYKAAYVDGQQNLLDAYAGRTPERWIFVSSTAVYGQTDGSRVDEASPTEPRGFSGRRLLEAERLAASAAATTCVLRLSGIYGPTRTRLIRRVREGGTYTLDGSRYGNRIHRDDCAGALRHILGLEAPPPVLLGVDDAPVPLEEVYAFIADELGVEPPTLEPPENPTGRQRSNKRCRNERLKATGYALRVPTYREGYGALIEA